jgi:hypothetical protein
MALSYNIWTEEQVKNRNNVPNGDYPFEIVGIAQKKTQPGVDKNGDPKPIRDMLEIDFEFMDMNGVIRKIKDWIVFMDGMDWKLRHLASTTGNIELYENKALEIHHFLRKKGVFTLGTRIFKDKNNNEKTTNNIIDYVKKEVATKQDNSFLDDDIPHM